ncbi:hypothetical protein HHI36_000746 [Cryptolaemus montrouzieri]|uniref:Uncharacterized protein n=1 Tax=Cryptolaemus montrouzieri TaxID=559131 RepID=A0ABD2P6X2_9CUCU
MDMEKRSSPGVTVHCIDNDYKRRFAANTRSLIQCDEIEEASSPSGSENELSGKLEVFEEEFGTSQEYEHDDLLLEENIVYDKSRNSLQPFHFKCNRHTLNLIAKRNVQALLANESTCLRKMYSTIIEKCYDLWSTADCRNQLR